MNTQWLDPSEPNERKPDIDELRLGDSVADDEKLRAFLQSIEKTVNADAPKSAGNSLVEFITSCATAPVKGGWSLVTFAVKKGADAFSNHIPALVRERSEARERDAFIEPRSEEIQATGDKTRAEADLLRAQAERVRAESEVLLAQADEERRQTNRKDALLREIRKRGIDFLAQQQGDILRVCFTKNDREESDEEQNRQ